MHPAGADVAADEVEPEAGAECDIPMRHPVTRGEPVQQIHPVIMDALLLRVGPLLPAVRFVPPRAGGEEPHDGGFGGIAEIPPNRG